MDWVDNNIGFLILAFLALLSALVIVLIAHINSLLEEVAFIAKLYEHTPPTQTVELLQEIKDEVHSISMRIDSIDSAKSD